MNASTIAALTMLLPFHVLAQESWTHLANDGPGMTRFVDVELVGDVVVAIRSYTPAAGTQQWSAHLVVLDGAGQQVNAQQVLGAGTNGILDGEPGWVYVVLGYGYNKNVNANYGSNDYWYRGGMMTHCGCGPNIGAQGECADKQIQARINLPIPLPSVNCFFSNIVSLAVGPISGGDVYYGYEWFETGIPETPHKMYTCCCGPWNCDPCFSPELMSFYTQGTWDVFEQLTPAGTQRINAKVELVWSLGGEEASYMHAGLFRYGKVNCRN